MKKILRFLFICILISKTLFSAEMDFYGNFNGKFNQYFFNDRGKRDFNLNEKADSAIEGNLYIGLNDELKNQLYIGLNYLGNFGENKSSQGDSIIVKQAYLTSYFEGGDIFYLGKKERKSGFANYFNVSNRITTKNYENGKSSTGTIGQVEWNKIINENYSCGINISMSDIKKADDILTMSFLEYQSGFFNMETMFYYGKGYRKEAGYNASLQFDELQLYCEGIVKGNAETKGINADGKINARNDGIWNEFTGGILYTGKDVDLMLEYLYRQEGADKDEQERYVKYSQAAAAAYAKHGLLKHYAAWRAGIKEFLLNGLSLNVGGVFSIQEAQDIAKYLSYEINTGIDFRINDSLSLEGGYYHADGGEFGEYNKLGTVKDSASISFNYYF